jgi:hypothetical protein
MMMRKQFPESTAAAALKGLSNAIDGWRAELRDATGRVIALEASGVDAVNPSDVGNYNPDEAARARLNGHAYIAAPSGGTKNLGIQLFETRRECDELRKTIDLAGAQWALASVDLGRELLQRHGGEIDALHRKRALAIVETFACTAQIEALRLKLLQAGSSVPHPLDGYSLRLGGQLTEPTNANLWQRKYLAECIRLGLIEEIK